MAAALTDPQASPGDISEEAWQQAAWLPCRLKAEVSVRGFTVGDLLRIEVGSLVDAGMPVDGDVSVCLNGARIGCARLELAGERLGARLTELL